MPYKSNQQRKFFNANRKNLEKQGVDVDEWNHSSKGMKLPKFAKKKRKKSKKKNENLICSFESFINESNDTAIFTFKSDYDLAQAHKLLDKSDICCDLDASSTDLTVTGDIEGIKKLFKQHEIEIKKVESIDENVNDEKILETTLVGFINEDKKNDQILYELSYLRKKIDRIDVVEDKLKSIDKRLSSVENTLVDVVKLNNLKHK